MGISGRDPYCHDLALVIDHQMELEAKEPTHGTAAPLGHSSQHFVLSTPCVMTDGQLGAIHKVDATPLSTKPVHQQVRRQEQSWHQIILGGAAGLDGPSITGEVSSARPSLSGRT